MPTWLAVILEIIKITVPALIVFITVWYLMREYLTAQFKMRHLELKEKTVSGSLPLRLQAYERLIMLCERIELPNLVIRLKGENMRASDLKGGMLMAIQQEYEHNITQQIYVSDELWQIILLAKNETANAINLLFSELPTNANADDFAKVIFEFAGQNKVPILNRAKQAVRTEAGGLL